MGDYPTIDDIERATYVAWLVTGVAGLISGAALWPVFRLIHRVTGMRVLSGLLTTLGGLCLVAVLDWGRYRIEEAPFEPPVWVDPGVISKLLPLMGMLLGFLVTRVVSRHVAAR
jgi:hypothetical protein